jgi:osmotically-inducible protein OsmY
MSTEPDTAIESPIPRSEPPHHSADQVIQQAVLAEIDRDKCASSNEIGVIVRDGVVTLAGKVDNYRKRQSAERSAHRVRGVKAVANDLIIHLPDDSRRDDACLAAEAHQALTTFGDIPTESIDITIVDGWITLKGTVPLQIHRAEAERAVRHVLGIRGITNLLTVEAALPLTSELKQEIEDTLVRGARIDANHINVEIDGSRAILRGEVRSLEEKLEIGRAVWHAPGITAVDNHLVIV